MTAAAQDQELARSIGSLAAPGILIGHRLIQPGDERALLPDESGAFANSVIKVRRASGAARLVARELMQRMGLPQQAVPKNANGAPVWPNGIAGSIAHDDAVAVAAIARQSDVRSLGIDVEPAEPLDPDLLEIVATPGERRRMSGDPCYGRLLFAVKEAVYKAAHPIDGRFLAHHDVEVDLATQQATIRGGRTVTFRFAASARIVVLAVL